MNNFKVYDSFYELLKKEDPVIYKLLMDPYAIMGDLKVNMPRVFNDGVNTIASVLKGFNSPKDLTEYLNILNTKSEVDACTYFKDIMSNEINYAEIISDKFFRDVAGKLEQDGSSLIETIKQTFIELVSSHIEDIKVFAKENYKPILKAVMCSGIVSQIYEAVNVAIDTDQPYTTVTYEVSESDLVNFALQNLHHTGNYGIVVNLIYTAFIIIVPLNRLDIVKC